MITILKKAIFFVISTFLGLLGGQKEKGARRFGIPGLALTASIGNLTLKHLSLLLLIPVLFMGYGENSWLMGVFHNDSLVRLAYAFLLSIPFMFWGLKRYAVSLVCLIGAFQIHAGKLFTVGTFDVLIEDIIRYGVLSIILMTIVFKHK